MLAGIRHLVIITFITLLCIVFAVFLLRQLGLQQQYSALDHPLLKKQPIVVANGGDESGGPPNSFSAFQEAAKWPEVWLKADLRLSKDHFWFLYSAKYLQEHTEGKGYPEHYTLAELQEINFKNSDEKILSLDQFLTAFGGKNLVLFIHTNQTFKLEELIKNIDDSASKDKVVIQSSYQTVMTKIRKKKPRWLYGLTSADFSKLRLFSSFFLEPILQFRGDIVISPEHSSFVGSFLPRMVTEVRRRGGIPILRSENLSDISATKVKKSFGGVMTRQPAFFVEAFKRNL